MANRKSRTESTLPFALPIGDQRLRILEKRNFVILVVMAIVSCLLFNFRHHIEDVMDSSDICENRTVREISKITLPKLNKHCDQILIAKSADKIGIFPTMYEFTYFYGRHDILVVLDIWVAIVFIIQFILHYRGNIWVYRAKEEEIYMFWKQNCFRCLYMVSINTLLFFGAIMWIFFWYPAGSLVHSPHDWEPDSIFSWVDIISDYGIGAFIVTLVAQIIVLARVPIVFFHVVILRGMRRLYR